MDEFPKDVLEIAKALNEIGKRKRGINGVMVREKMGIFYLFTFEADAEDKVKWGECFSMKVDVATMLYSQLKLVLADYAGRVGHEGDKNEKEN